MMSLLVSFLQFINDVRRFITYWQLVKRGVGVIVSVIVGLLFVFYLSTKFDERIALSVDLPSGWSHTWKLPIGPFLTSALISAFFVISIVMAIGFAFGRFRLPRLVIVDEPEVDAAFYSWRIGVKNVGVRGSKNKG